MRRQPFNFFSTASETYAVKVHIRNESNMLRSGVANWQRLNQISCGQSLFSFTTLKNFIRIRMRVRGTQHMWKSWRRDFPTAGTSRTYTHYVRIDEWVSPLRTSADRASWSGPTQFTNRRPLYPWIFSKPVNFLLVLLLKLYIFSHFTGRDLMV